jgi:antagonist of KipI
MGYRLEGSVAWPDLPGSLLSAATTLGAVQVPPGGEPILLMADHQTTGGYAQLAVLCRADRQVAGQLAPGDAVRFRAVSLEEARAAYAAREALLDELAPEARV